MGRPSKYKKEYDEQARKLCSTFGAIDRDLGEFFGVEKTTIENWKNAHPSFRKAVEIGKEPADARVERALYTRAIGFQSDDGKTYPPETAACIFWLCNRKPDSWRQLKAVEMTGKDGGPVPLKVVKSDLEL